jgi:hypothetical protein
MSRLNENELLAFRDELKKTAAPNLHRLLGGVGAGAGVGALTGSLGGAALGAVRGAKAGREEGTGAIVGGLSGALGGAVRGAGIGAAVGGAGGALAPRMGNLSSASGAVGASARFGKRQLHALTGWTPEGGLEAIRGGAYDSRQALRTAKTPHIQQAQKALSSAASAQRMGLTSLPGYAKAIKEKGLKEVAKTDAAAQWHSGGIDTKALGIGLPALALASEVGKKESPEGPGKGELLGRSAAGTVGGLLGSAMPIAGQIALGGAMGAAGGIVGRGVDRLRKRRPPTSGQSIPPEQQSGSHVPTERVTSSAAAGQIPEGLSA